MRRDLAVLVFKHCLWMSGILGAAVIGGCASVPELHSGIDRSNFDTSVKPGDDFFQYVNGRWNEKNPIPAENSRWGSFPKLRDDNLAALRVIVEENAEHYPNLAEGDNKTLAEFYLSAMDESALEKNGANALSDDLAAISKIERAADLPEIVGHLHSMGVGTLLLWRFRRRQEERPICRPSAAGRFGSA